MLFNLFIIEFISDDIFSSIFIFNEMVVIIIVSLRLLSNKVIFEMSQGSRFYLNEQRKAAQLQVRLDAMALQVAEWHRRPNHQREEAEIQARVAELEAERDLTRCVAHVDLDAFFA